MNAVRLTAFIIFMKDLCKICFLKNNYKFLSLHCWLNDLAANSGMGLSSPQSGANNRFISSFLKNKGLSIFLRVLQCHIIVFNKLS